MATSGTYAIEYDIAEFTDEAFERCNVDPATLTARHMRSARRSLNLLFSRWATNGVNLFAVDEQTEAAVEGTASYSVAAGTLAMLDVVVRRNGIDIPVHIIDREQYHAIPTKTTASLPSMVYFDRKAGTFHLWGAPDNSTDVIRYQRLRRIQDVTAGAETADVTYEWYEALASGLAEHLALKFAPERFDKLAVLAGLRFAEANSFNRQRTDTTFGT